MLDETGTPYPLDETGTTSAPLDETGTTPHLDETSPPPIPPNVSTCMYEGRTHMSVMKPSTVLPFIFTFLHFESGLVDVCSKIYIGKRDRKAFWFLSPNTKIDYMRNL